MNFYQNEINISKTEYFIASSLFFEEFLNLKPKIEKAKNHPNCLQSNKLFKVFYFHVFNFAKFG